MRKTLPKFYDLGSDLIQCQYCKRQFKSLGAHLGRLHRADIEDYKLEFGLINGDLISQGTRNLQQKGQYRRIKNNPNQAKKNYHNLQKARKKLKGIQRNWSDAANKIRIEQLRKFSHLPETQKKATEGLKKFWKTQEGKKIQKEIHNQQKTGLDQICKFCLTPFYIPLNRVKTANYCSRKCKWLDIKPHGTMARYSGKKCRCEECKKAWSEYNKQRKS